MGFFDFLEHKIVIVPVGNWFTLPKWLIHNPKFRSQRVEMLSEAERAPSEKLNRRHCGQSQHSAVIRQKSRVAESKVLGAQRKEKAKPKRKSAVSSDAKIFIFRRRKS